MGVKQIVHVNNLSYNTSGFHSVLIEHIRNKCIELLIKVQVGRINSMLYDHFVAVAIYTQLQVCIRLVNSLFFIKCNKCIIISSLLAIFL